MSLEGVEGYYSPNWCPEEKSMLVQTHRSFFGPKYLSVRLYYYSTNQK